MIIFVVKVFNSKGLHAVNMVANFITPLVIIYQSIVACYRMFTDIQTNWGITKRVSYSVFYGVSFLPVAVLLTAEYLVAVHTGRIQIVDNKTEPVDNDEQVIGISKKVASILTNNKRLRYA